MIARVLTAAALVALVGCKEQPQGPIAGLHSAASAVKVLRGEAGHSLAVGSELTASDELEATGPAVIEYYGGAVLFLEEGDRITVGQRQEARLVGSNLPEQTIVKGEPEEIPKTRRIIAARYRRATFTPESVQQELGTGDYLKAFFTPNGIANLGKSGGQTPEGPRRPLPPPPHRAKVPHIHAAPLGERGPLLTVDDGYAAVETPALSTAILLEDEQYELGNATRLLLPDGAEVTLELVDGTSVELEGPADFRLPAP